jgi:hypothetical protein
MSLNKAATVASPRLDGPLLSIGRQQFGNVLVKPNQADLLLKELCEPGKVRPVIDRRFALSEVPSAVRYVEDGHAPGKVVITVAGAVEYQRKSSAAAGGGIAVRRT